MEIAPTSLGLGPDLEQSLRAIVAHFQAQIGTIHTLESDGMLHMRAHTPGIPDAVLAVTQVIPVGKGIAGLAVERKAPVNLCNLQQDKSGDARPGARATGAMGSLCVPMLVGDEVVGALGIATMGERNFTDHEVATLLDVGKRLAGYVVRHT
jgi:signal transduction protein with GAF and PtsI domain